MQITRIGSQPSAKGPADWFTGAVRIDSRFQREAPARIGGATVTFEPGARTAWHTHPLGQTLLVTAGCGRVQRDGGPIEEIRAGDTVWFEPGNSSGAPNVSNESNADTAGRRRVLARMREPPPPSVISKMLSSLAANSRPSIV